MISRRSLLFSSVAASAGCGRKRGDGYAGYAFVANEEGGAVAAVDLTAFAVSRHIRLDGAPTQVIAHPQRALVYALTPSTGRLHEIDAATLQVARTAWLGHGVLSMRLGRTADDIWVSARSPACLLRVDLNRLEVEGSIALPEPPADFDLSAYFEGGGYVDVAAASHGAARAVSLIDIARRRVSTVSRLDGHAGTVRFRSDGRSVLAANTTAQQLTVLDTATGQVIVHLPLSLRPDQFCFTRDGGQLFITGEGRDAVVVVYPYYVPEVAETVLAGSRPGAMAASNQHLFVANPQAGDISILSILRRRVIAVAAVGADPGHITVTPDDEYALVLNRRSGDMAVIRIAGLQPDRRKAAALFTMIPVGSRPVSAAVKAV